MGHTQHPTQDVPTGRRIGERLVQAGAITPDQLRQGLHEHRRAGVRVGSALLNMGFIGEEDLTAGLADQLGLPFVDLRAQERDPAVVTQLPADLVHAHGVLPLYDDGGRVAVAFTDAPTAQGVSALEEGLGRPVQPVLVAESAFQETLDEVFRDEYLEQAASALLTRSPRDSARWVLSRGQKLFFIALLAAIGIGLLRAPVGTLTLFTGLSTALYISFSLYKLQLAFRALTHTLEVETTAAEIAALDDRDLPIYTILVPVYRESEVFPILVDAIDQLDYPKIKLEVKILLEEDDVETIELARRSNLPGHFKLVVVPNGLPKGKPKACNYGLIRAQGEYVVIYDAEDIPEPDQLKKAIVAFGKGEPHLACVQAKLNYFNGNQNLLTRWFTTEYSMWFDLFLPGLDASQAPIPLGGTSNHFRTAQLRALGAWDPYNVTEDADLGIRMYKAGWKTSVIDSTTYEEANSGVYNWIRQRSRWIKGYIQTYLVHMRHPFALRRSLGTGAFLSFQLVIGGTFFVLLINPVFWLLTLAWFLSHWAIIQATYPAPIFYGAGLALCLGNFIFMYLNIMGCVQREYGRMAKYALLSPIYWVLMSVAAWKGFVQLFYAPSFWEKTKHGLYRRDAAEIMLPARGGER